MKLISTSRRGVAAGFAMLAFVAMLAVPAVAQAATFSRYVPAVNSSSANANPAISVYVYDRYGVKGTGTYTMTVDGRAVRATIVYSSRYTRFTVKGQAALRVGRHTVVVRVKNVRRQWSAATWRFTVAAPPNTTASAPPTYPGLSVITLWATGGSGTVAHTYYRLDDGPRLEGAAVLGTYAVGTHKLEFWSVDSAGNQEPHKFLSFIVIDIHAPPAQGSDLACVSCHGSGSIAALHAVPGGPGCNACHANGAMPTNDCGAPACHGVTYRPAHPAAALSHETSGTCISTQCHDTNVTVIHGASGGPGCVACHAPGTTRSIVCADCHAASKVHPLVAAKHIRPSGVTCTARGCHDTGDVTTIHRGNCSACHGSAASAGILTTNCPTCHVTDPHPNAALAHLANPADQHMIINGVDHGVHACAECHSLAIDTVHGGNCDICHSSGIVSSFSTRWGRSCVQGGCHGVTSRFSMHANIDNAHAVASPFCTQSGECHAGGNDVTAIHENVGGCALCHGDPNVLPTTDCTKCHDLNNYHTGQMPDHVASAAPTITPTINNTTYPDMACTTCHGADLIVVHKSQCMRCHAAGGPRGSVDPWAKGCIQGSCHTSVPLDAIHPITDSAHTLATLPTCITDACHHHTGSDLASIHHRGGCLTCHRPGQVATNDCTQCHGPVGSDPHVADPTKHAVAASGCLTGNCHATLSPDVSLIHAAAPNGCATCHTDNATPTLTCITVGCHATQHTGLLKHTASASDGACVTSSCHATDVSLVHNGKCAPCHASDATPSTTCADCHQGTVSAIHPNADTAHVASGTCVSSTCHKTDVRLIHVLAGVDDCQACHSPGKPKTTTCLTDGCHAGDLNTLHPNAAASHVATSACGGGGKDPMCHASPSTNATDVTVIHSLTKADGSAGPGCAACHNNDPKTPSPLTGNCTACHPTNPHASEASHLVGSPQINNYSCTNLQVPGACHNPDMSVIHKNQSGVGTDGTVRSSCGICHSSKPLRYSTYVKVDCINECHPQYNVHPGWEKHNTTDTRCLNQYCHTLPGTAPFSVTILGYTHDCSYCHRGTDTGTKPLFCPDCHTGMLNYHAVSETSHIVPVGVCVASGCHGTNLALTHANATTTSNGITYRYCAVCHALNMVPTSNCKDCHADHYDATGHAVHHWTP
jgi:hypothetical protein